MPDPALRASSFVEVVVYHSKAEKRVRAKAERLEDGAMEQDDGFGFWVRSLAEVVDVAVGAQTTDDRGTGCGVNGWRWEPTGTLPSSPTRTSGQNELGVDVFTHGPAGEPAAIKVQDASQIEPAFVGGNVGDVPEPDFGPARKNGHR